MWRRRALILLGAVVIGLVTGMILAKFGVEPPWIQVVVGVVVLATTPFAVRYWWKPRR
ncbi:hypothetical protein JNUCC0626_04585 [Lentzea sp. JNUCC 0626]|uniref:hypothetical protein n=1 Tax=Lentzea sp. JNUCC 0626 TaxID=3367513 RepID=UPI003749E858